MSTEMIFGGVILALLIVMLIGLFVMYRIMKILGDKIAMPIYDVDTKKTVFVRPEKPAPTVVDPKDQNLPQETEYQHLEEVQDDILYEAIAGKEK